MNERRVVRSPEPKTALYLYLLNKAQKLGLSALALASREGLLVTGTRGDRAVDLETLAALSPALAGDEAVSPSFIGRAVPGTDVVASKLELCGEAFYLASVGGVPPRTSEVKETLTRLLAA